MKPRRYAVVRRPWAARLDVTHPGPAAQFARIATQALRYGLPAMRGPLWAHAGRRSVPVRPLAATLRRMPGRPDPELDALLEAVLEDWPRLAATSGRLPAVPPRLGLLALERAAARTVFVLGDRPHPLLVLKLPRGDADLAGREAAALVAVEGAGAAPRTLGRLGDAWVEEGMPGAPLRVTAVRAADAGRLEWAPVLGSIADGLARVADVTAAPGDVAERLQPSVDAALASDLLRAPTRRALEAAWRDVRTLRTTVLRHHDTSPQNCLVDGDRLSALVDWEMARLGGAPGFDVLNLAQAYLDNGVGLVHWSQDLVVEAFERSWSAGGYWRAARAAADDAARAAGVPETALAALQVVFFGSRVGDRLGRPGWHPTTAATAARLLEVAVR